MIVHKPRSSCHRCMVILCVNEDHGNLLVKDRSKSIHCLAGHVSVKQRGLLRVTHFHKS